MPSARKGHVICLLSEDIAYPNSPNKNKVFLQKKLKTFVILILFCLECKYVSNVVFCFVFLDRRFGMGVLCWTEQHKMTYDSCSSWEPVCIGMFLWCFVVVLGWVFFNLSNWYVVIACISQRPTKQKLNRDYELKEHVLNNIFSVYCSSRCYSIQSTLQREYS